MSIPSYYNSLVDVKLAPAKEISIASGKNVSVLSDIHHSKQAHVTSPVAYRPQRPPSNPDSKTQTVTTIRRSRPVSNTPIPAVVPITKKPEIPSFHANRVKQQPQPSSQVHNTIPKPKKKEVLSSLQQQSKKEHDHNEVYLDIYNEILQKENNNNSSNDVNHSTHEEEVDTMDNYEYNENRTNTNTNNNHVKYGYSDSEDDDEDIEEYYNVEDDADEEEYSSHNNSNTSNTSNNHTSNNNNHHHSNTKKQLIVPPSTDETASRLYIKENELTDKVLKVDKDRIALEKELSLLSNDNGVRQEKQRTMQVEMDLIQQKYVEQEKRQKLAIITKQKFNQQFSQKRKPPVGFQPELQTKQQSEDKRQHHDKQSSVKDKSSDEEDSYEQTEGKKVSFSTQKTTPVVKPVVKPTIKYNPPVLPPKREIQVTCTDSRVLALAAAMKKQYQAPQVSLDPEDIFSQLKSHMKK